MRLLGLVGCLPAGTAQHIGQWRTREALHVVRLDISKQIVQAVELVTGGRYIVVDLVVHVDYIDALVHDYRVVVVVVRKEVQQRAQFLCDQRVFHLGGLLDQEHDDVLVAVEALTSRKER